MITAKKITDVLYFSFGSNMNMRQISSRCIISEIVDIAYFNNHKLGFYGNSKIWDGAVETCIPDNNSKLWGVIYRLKLHALDSLDAWQGVRFDGSVPYFHYPAVVESSEGKTYDVLLYKKDILAEPKTPSTEYKEFILQGALMQNLPSVYIETLKHLDSHKASYPVPQMTDFDPVTLVVEDCSGCECS